MSNATLIDVKQAIASAIAFIKKVYSKPEGLRLEEIELSDDDRYWLVTLGFDEAAAKAAMSPLQQALMDSKFDRVYKIIKVDAKTGEAVSMKIRAV